MPALASREELVELFVLVNASDAADDDLDECDAEEFTELLVRLGVFYGPRCVRRRRVCCVRLCLSAVVWLPAVVVFVLCVIDVCLLRRVPLWCSKSTVFATDAQMVEPIRSLFDHMNRSGAGLRCSPVVEFNTSKK